MGTSLLSFASSSPGISGRAALNAALLSAMLLLGATAGHAQSDDGWVHITRTGTSPLGDRRKWATDHEKGKRSDAAIKLARLLDFNGTGEPARLNADRNYVVAVGTDRWTEMYLLRAGCFNFSSGALEIDTNGDCDLAGTRIMNSPAVSIIGIKTFSATTTLEWEVTTTKRRKLDVLGFISFVLPALAAGVVPAAAADYQYSVAIEALTIKRLPADHEVAAKYTRNTIAGKPEAFSRTFNNYANEFVSLGVGVGVTKVKDINLDFTSNSLSANEIKKLKMFGLVALHPQAVDPDQPRTWTIPYVLAAIEISSEHFNYGAGGGWRLPFVNNTAVAVAWMNNLPDVADNAKGAASTEKTAREWKTTFMIHYTFPLPAPGKKE